MKTKLLSSKVPSLLGLIWLLGMANAVAEEATPLLEGGYVSPMVAYRRAFDNSVFGNGLGGNVLFGYRHENWAIEAGGGYSTISTGSTPSTSLVGFNANGLLFPFRSLPALYGLVGAGALTVGNYPGTQGRFTLVTYNAGLGYLFNVHLGSYDFALRTEARYEFGSRDRRLNEEHLDLNAPKSYNSALLNVGLYLPLGKKPRPPAAAPEPPITVVEPVKPSDSTAPVPAAKPATDGTSSSKSNDVPGAATSQVPNPGSDPLNDLLQPETVNSPDAPAKSTPQPK